MRQTLKAAGLASLLLLSVTDLSAEPLVKGFFVEKLPANSQSQALAPGKGLVLAHVLNQSEEAITKGNYQIGVQIEDKGSVKTYSLTPKDSITPGALKTFRMAVPVEGVDKTTGQFRVFSRINGVTTWSEKYSFLQGIQSSTDKNGVTTLYTEAPAVDEKKIARKEVPFENNNSSVNNTVAKSISDETTKAAAQKVASTVDKTAQKVEQKAKTEATKVKQEVAEAEKTVNNAVSKANTEVASAKTNAEVKVTKAKTAAEALKQLEEKKAAKAKEAEAKAKAAEAKAVASRKINPSDFKKLKTIDEELIIYVVKDGDTLKSIAENYYGTASKERTIADLNYIEKSSAVRVGEEIIVEVRPLEKTKG